MLTKYEAGYWKFYTDAQAAASHSKDPSTKVGAVVLGPGHEVRSSGWNGAPRRSTADEDERWQDREQKLKWVVHAEANAIANAARSGAALNTCAMVVTHAPCLGCAKLIVQAGIILVMAPQPEPAFAERWAEDMAMTRRLFAECGVQMVLV